MSKTHAAAAFIDALIMINYASRAVTLYIRMATYVATFRK